MITRKLYRDYPYQTECEATVTAVGSDGIELDQTVFFGEAGGQVGDTGAIESVNIVNATHHSGQLLLRPDAPVIKVSTTIVHIPLQAPALPAVGTRVRVQIDWERRYRIMRMHSAAHLVYHHALKYFGPDGSQKLRGNLKGCHIADNTARFDFAASGKLNEGDLGRIQDAANEMVVRALDITYQVDDAEPDLRYWRCGEIEMYCGGTHVRSTDEIGLIRVRRQNKGSGLERVYLEIQ